MKLEILLVRHGESEGNRDGIFTGHGASRLTERGRRQAEATARALAHQRLDAIFTSDLARSAETAAALAAVIGLAPVATEALRERSVGEWLGLSFREVQERFPDEWRALLSRDPDFRAPGGGESHRDCSRRVGDFLDELLAHPPRPAGEDDGPARVALFSHGVAIHHMLRHVLGVGPGDGRCFFAVENCSVQRFEHRDDATIRIYSINDVSHLRGIE